jgi:hypothetical protein
VLSSQAPERQLDIGFAGITPNTQHFVGISH